MDKTHTHKQIFSRNCNVCILELLHMLDSSSASYEPSIKLDPHMPVSMSNNINEEGIEDWWAALTLFAQIINLRSLKSNKYNKNIIINHTYINIDSK